MEPDLREQANLHVLLLLHHIHVRLHDPVLFRGVRSSGGHPVTGSTLCRVLAACQPEAAHITLNLSTSWPAGAATTTDNDQLTESSGRLQELLLKEE